MNTTAAQYTQLESPNGATLAQDEEALNNAYADAIPQMPTVRHPPDPVSS